METEASELFQAALLGIDFEELKKNKAFQVLLEHLQRQAEEAREELTVAPITRPAEIQALQNTVWKFRGLIEIIDGFIQQGQLAQEKLEEEAHNQ